MDIYRYRIYITNMSFLLLMSMVSCRTYAQFDYFEKAPPGKTATRFAPGVISTDAVEHSAPAFSPDGRKVLWTIMELPSYKTYLMEMDFQNGQWSAPHRPSFQLPDANYAFPSWSSDGQILYFSSTRKSEYDTLNQKGNQLWQVEWNGKQWQEPKRISPVFPPNAYALSVSKAGTVYFTHGPFRSSDWNILHSTISNKTYDIPTSLPINTTYYEDGPCIAPDESFILFESNRPGSIEGSIDIYIAFRTQGHSWSEPINLGPIVNSPATERFAKLSPDGKYIFFCSDRRTVNGSPNLDMYWIDASFIYTMKRSQQ
jgi:Tol biopolymer transport system component